jgi:hypothetical protein
MKIVFDYSIKSIDTGIDPNLRFKSSIEIEEDDLGCTSDAGSKLDNEVKEWITSMIGELVEDGIEINEYKIVSE